VHDEKGKKKKHVLPSFFAKFIFYKGIPHSMHRKISILGYFRDEFDLDNRDFLSDSDSDVDLGFLGDLYARGTLYV
jgi:hypothetical protein